MSGVGEPVTIWVPVPTAFQGDEDVRAYAEREARKIIGKQMIGERTFTLRDEQPDVPPWS